MLTAPLRQGFGSFVGTVSNLDRQTYLGHLGDYYEWALDTEGVVSVETTYATTRIADAAIERLDAMRPPWLLVLSFHAPHDPYSVPPVGLADTEEDTATGAYRAMTTAVDAELGRVLASMTDGQRAATTIVVVGDNGRPYDLDVVTSDRLKFTTYEGGVHVPLIVAGPRVAHPGSRSDALVSIADLYPTVAAIAEVDDVSGQAIDGLSLLPALLDPAAPVHDEIVAQMFASADSYTYAIRDDRYKLMVNRAWSWADGEDATYLFDLDADPGELQDLAADPAHADVRAGLQADIDDLLARMASDSP